ncbi:anti-sigma factor family protein [Monashia sp. NPDC004114]
MTCQELVELVTAYLEDALPAAQRAAFEEHLRLCPGCDHYLAQFRLTIKLLGSLPEEALSAPGRQRLLDAFADWRDNPGPAVP